MALQSPSRRPSASASDLRALLKEKGVAEKVVVVGVRGYFASLGAPGRNDRGIYDDAMFLVTPEDFHAWNANTDPSVARPGVAVLQPGRYRYRLGIHGLSRPKAQRYPAFVQNSPVDIVRDGGARSRGWYGINIHRGSVNSTSSLGCQTVRPDQWATMRDAVVGAMRAHGQDDFLYVLLDGPVGEGPLG